MNKIALSLLATVLGLSTFAPAAPADENLAGIMAGRTYQDYSVYSAAGETVVIVVVGDGSTDLDLKVFDGFGNLIAADIDRTDRCVVRWFTTGSGYFTARIENLGYGANVYVMRVARR